MPGLKIWGIQSCRGKEVNGALEQWMAPVGAGFTSMLQAQKTEGATGRNDGTWNLATAGSRKHKWSALKLPLHSMNSKSIMHLNLERKEPSRTQRKADFHCLWCLLMVTSQKQWLVYKAEVPPKCSPQKIIHRYRTDLSVHPHCWFRASRGKQRMVAWQRGTISLNCVSILLKSRAVKILDVVKCRGYLYTLGPVLSETI